MMHGDRTTMRTTIDLPKDLLEKAMACSGARSKRDAVCWALEEAVRRRAIKDLLNLKEPIEFEFTADELEAREITAEYAKRKRQPAHRR